MKTNWQEQRNVRLLKTSATQHETFDLCRRKWWLGSVRKLPTQSSSSQVFGTVLHGVCERFLRADNLGRDEKTGLPVELYPEGWWIAKDRFDVKKIEGEVTPAEQDIIKKLIAKAIEEGVLERMPDRQIEKQFTRTIFQLECPACGGAGCETCNGDGKGTHIQVTGFIDYLWSEGVIDHKTAGSMRYVKSPEGLRKNTQMLLYAFEFLKSLHERKKPLPEKVILRHNVFCKDPDDLRVRKTEVAVTPDEIKAAWLHVEENSVEMERLRRTTERWHQVPDPVNMSAACNAYGGCPFRSVCSGHESEEGYEKRLDRVNNKGYTEGIALENTINQSTQSTKGPTMSFAARIAQMKSVNQASASVAPVNPPPLKESAAPTAGSVPPWANAACVACRGIGFNSKGSPCRICDGKASQAGGGSGPFLLEPTGNGSVIWQHKEDDAIGGETFFTATAPVKVEDKQPAVEVEAPKVVKVPKTPKVVVPAPAEVVEEAEVEEDVEPTVENVELQDTLTNDIKDQNGPGRPRLGYTLLVNCSPNRGMDKKTFSGKFVYLTDLLVKLGNLMALKGKVESFYDLNAFDRRDALMKEGPNIAKHLGSKTVVCSGIGTGQSDMKALFDGIRPYAAGEIWPEL